MLLHWKRIQSWVIISISRFADNCSNFANSVSFLDSRFRSDHSSRDEKQLKVWRQSLIFCIRFFRLVTRTENLDLILLYLTIRVIFIHYWSIIVLFLQQKCLHSRQNTTHNDVSRDVTTHNTEDCGSRVLMIERSQR